MTKLPSVQVNGLILSDLFFNIEKPCYDAVDRSNTFSDKWATEERIEREDQIREDEKAALMADATDFAAMLGNQVTASELVEDFFARV